jgi:hypothetical protein
MRPHRPHTRRARGPTSPAQRAPRSRGPRASASPSCECISTHTRPHRRRGHVRRHPWFERRKVLQAADRFHRREARRAHEYRVAVPFLPQEPARRLADRTLDPRIAHGREREDLHDVLARARRSLTVPRHALELRGGRTRCGSGSCARGEDRRRHARTLGQTEEGWQRRGARRREERHVEVHVLLRAAMASVYERWEQAA